MESHPKDNANYGWIQHMIHHLAPNGKLGIVLSNGSLSSTTSGEGKIEKILLKMILLKAL